VGPVVVVEGAEGVELELELAIEWGGAWWARKRLRSGGSVRPCRRSGGGRGGVLGEDAEPFQLGLEEDLALAGLSGEDGAVVGEQCGGVSVEIGG